MRAIFAILSVVAFINSTGCTNTAEQKETNALAQAQQCLDRIPDADYTNATNCLSYTSGYSSARANLMNCSIYLTAGGLTTSRMIDAYNTSQDNSLTTDQKNAVYISYLSFAKPSGGTLTDAYNNAVAAQAYCAASGETNFMFVASMSVLGSLTASLTPAGFTFDPSDPNNAQNLYTAAQTALAKCQTDVTLCNPTTIAPMIVSTASSYCSGTNANPDVCGYINSAVQTYSAGGDSEIAAAMSCLLQGYTSFTDPTTSCTH